MRAYVWAEKEGTIIMLFRSTGLGDTELVGVVDHLERRADYLIMYVNVTDPVKWKVRAALNLRDLGRVIWCSIRWSILSLFLSPRQWFKKQPNHPDDY
jgi:hypothetical protein